MRSREDALREIHRRFRIWLDEQMLTCEDPARIYAITDITQAYDAITHDVVLALRESNRRDANDPAA